MACRVTTVGGYRWTQTARQQSAGGTASPPYARRRPATTRAAGDDDTRGTKLDPFSRTNRQTDHHQPPTPARPTFSLAPAPPGSPQARAAVQRQTTKKKNNSRAIPGFSLSLSLSGPGYGSGRRQNKNWRPRASTIFAAKHVDPSSVFRVAAYLQRACGAAYFLSNNILPVETQTLEDLKLSTHPCIKKKEGTRTTDRKNKSRHRSLPSAARQPTHTRSCGRKTPARFFDELRHVGDAKKKW